MSGPGVPNRALARLHGMRTLVENGVLRPMRPDRLLRMVGAFWRWNTSMPLGFAAGAVRHPDRPAVIDEHGAVSYAEINDRTTRLAHGLASLGVREGTWVGVLCGNHRALVETLVAGSKLGANMLLLTRSLSPEQVADFLDEHQVDIVVIDDEFRPRLRAMTRRVTTVTAWAESPTRTPTVEQLVLDSPNRPLPRRNRIRDTVVLTSRSHGRATAATHSTPSRITPAATVFGRIPLEAGERTLMAAPLSHTWGLSALHLTVVLGATLILLREPAVASVLPALRRYRCTSMFTLPSMVSDLVEVGRPPQGLPSLHAVISTGAPLPGDLAARFRAEYGPVLYNLYGTTELSWVSIATPADLRRAPGTVGRPPRELLVTIRDEQDRVLPTGRVGRIFVESAERDAPADPTATGPVFTGDVGHLDATGLLFVDGSAVSRQGDAERGRSRGE